MTVAVSKKSDPSNDFLKHIKYLKDMNILPASMEKHIQRLRELANVQNHEITTSSPEDADFTMSIAKLLMSNIYLADPPKSSAK